MNSALQKSFLNTLKIDNKVIGVILRIKTGRLPERSTTMGGQSLLIKLRSKLKIF